ncbi:MAG TPA: hypothetical protein PK360_05665 [bacterium]|nr:hypothetical protein [bacterium]
MNQIIIYVRGGIVQDIISDSDNLSVMLVDYDNEIESEEVDRNFQPIKKDLKYFQLTLDGKEL